MKKLLSLFIMCCVAGCICAQDAKETKALINSIKRSTAYLSAEATMSTEAEAMATAKELLVSEINEWVDAKRKGDRVKQIVLQDINSCTQLMDMKRGIKTRAFVYVKKRDIVLIYGEGQIVLNENEESNDIQALSTISADRAESETHAANAPQDNMIQQKNHNETAQQGNLSAAKPAVTPSTANIETSTDNLQQILMAKTMFDLKPVFASLKQSGCISYGVYTSRNDLQNGYLLFYNRKGEILQVVKYVDGTLYDLSDGGELDFASFTGSAAYWFILK